MKLPSNDDWPMSRLERASLLALLAALAGGLLWVICHLPNLH